MSKENIKKIIIVIGILIIPLMYSYFYLNAFWDPYSNLEHLPVAVVNEDEGAIINSKNRNLGNELMDKLSNNKQLNFIITDKTSAQDGLNNRKYYATIMVPNNFSKNISSMTDEKKISANLIYSPNEETNYLASQILRKSNYSASR